MSSAVIIRDAVEVLLDYVGRSCDLGSVPEVEGAYLTLTEWVETIPHGAQAVGALETKWTDEMIATFLYASSQLREDRKRHFAQRDADADFIIDKWDGAPWDDMYDILAGDADESKRERVKAWLDDSTDVMTADGWRPTNDPTNRFTQ